MSLLRVGELCWFDGTEIEISRLGLEGATEATDNCVRVGREVTTVFVPADHAVRDHEKNTARSMRSYPVRNLSINPVGAGGAGREDDDQVARSVEGRGD